MGALGEKTEGGIAGEMVAGTNRASCGVSLRAGAGALGVGAMGRAAVTRSWPWGRVDEDCDALTALLRELFLSGVSGDLMSLPEGGDS